MAAGIETKIGDVLASTLRAARVEHTTEIVHLPPRAEDIPRHFADVTKLSALGFATRHALDDSIRDVVAYYLSGAAALAG